jgi:hypothetical protein
MNRLIDAQFYWDERKEELVIFVNGKEHRRKIEDLIEQAKKQEPILDKIRAEIEKAVWEDVIVSLDGTDEVRIPRLEPDDVFEIINKYKAER